MPKKMMHIRFSETQRFKRISQFWPEYRNWCKLTRRKGIICYLVDFALPTDNRVKIKEKQKINT